MSSTAFAQPARPDVRLGTTALHTALTSSLLALALALVPAPATAQSACGGFYTVDSGDTLVEIAERCGVTLPALVAENAGVMDDLDIEVGDRLRVPNPRGAQPSPVQACGAFYTVRTGDTVAEIAAKCGLTIPLLIAANPPLPSPLGVHADMRIRIPDVSRAAVEDPATVATVRRMTAAAPADTAALGDAEVEAAPVPSEDMVRVEGVLQAGDPCIQVREADGDVFALTGELSDAFGPGDRVVLMGVPTAEEECGQSPTLELRILYRAGT